MPPVYWAMSSSTGKAESYGPAGFFRSRQVDVSIRVQAHTESMRRLIRDRVFKTAIRLRNAS